MVLLASCGYEKSKEIKGKLVMPSEVEGSKSSDKVLLNVVVNGTRCSEVFSGLNGNVQCVTFVGAEKATYCPEELKGNVFNEYSIEDIESGNISPIMGVVDLIRLPKGYCDMRSIKGWCEKYPSVRVIGGDLLGIEGVRIGRYDKGKENMSPVFNDVQDYFVEVDLGNLEGVSEVIKASRSKLEGVGNEGKSEKKKAEKAAPRRIAVFNGMFGGAEVDF